MEIDADVVIVGAGPAGASAALLLAPYHRTLMVDQADLDSAGAPLHRIGESLPAVARRMLRDMGLWEDFQKQGHLACHGARSVWGAAEPVCADSIRDPDGPGWHLDRSAFDAWLRRCARERGAAMVCPMRVTGLRQVDDGWRIALRRHGRDVSVNARFVIDAGGRASPVVRSLGQRARQGDRLICRWLHGAADGDAGTTFIAAEPDGWWYTVALPERQRVLAFYTDSDLPAARQTVGIEGLMARARAQHGIAALLDEVGFRPHAAEAGYCAAHSTKAASAIGPRWLAVGDAAMSFDPISSQGLINALYTALAAADAVTSTLAGDVQALTDYQQTVDRVADAYRNHLPAWYAMESRWSDRPFWARRRAAHDAPT